jgi:hypothetical protein
VVEKVDDRLTTRKESQVFASTISYLLPTIAASVDSYPAPRSTELGLLPWQPLFGDTTAFTPMSSLVRPLTHSIPEGWVPTPAQWGSHCWTDHPGLSDWPPMVDG